MGALRTFQVTLGRDVTLDCAEHGSPSGLPLLLIHGYSDSRRSYEPLMAELARDFRAIAVTLRGHGDSSKPCAGYGAAELAGDLVGMLDRLAIARAVVVGHSMGSMVARRLAIDHPDRVRSLMLIGAFATASSNSAIVQLWNEVDTGLTDPVDAGFVRAFQESTLARPVPPAFLEMVIAESLKMPVRVWRDALLGMIADESSGQLHRVIAPTLILWGDQDGICDRAAQTWLTRKIAHARLSIHFGAGHTPHWEDPKSIASEIAHFTSQAGGLAA